MRLPPASEAGGILFCGNRWRGGVRRWRRCLAVGRSSVIFISSSGNLHLLLIRVVEGELDPLLHRRADRANTAGGTL